MTRVIRQSLAPLALLLAIVIAMRRVILQLIWHAPLTDVVSPYNLAILSFDYFQNGFIRRGLGGTIVAMLGGGRDHMAASILFFLLSAIWLAVPLLVLLRRLERQHPGASLWPAALLVASPQLFWAWGQDIARADMLVEGVIAWAAIAALDRRLTLAAVLLVFGALSHETALFYGVALLAAIWLVDFRAGRSGWREAVVAVAVLAVLLLATMIAQHVLGDRHGAIQTILRRYPGSPDAVYFTFGGLRGILVSTCGSIARPGFLLFIVSIYVILLCYVPLLFYRRRLSWLFFGIAAVMPMTALSIVAIDYGRWLVFAVANAWIGYIVLRLRGVEPVAVANRGRLVAIALLVILLALRSTAPMYPTLGLGKLRDRLWGEEPVFAADRCDPEWREVLRS